MNQAEDTMDLNDSNDNSMGGLIAAGLVVIAILVGFVTAGILVF